MNKSQKILSIVLALGALVCLSGVWASTSSQFTINNVGEISFPSPSTDSLILDVTLPTPNADTLVDADGAATLGAGTASLSAGDAVVAYTVGNNAGNAVCVDDVNAPTAVRLDDGVDCTNNTTKEGTYVLDGAATAATATLTVDEKANLANNEYFILTDIAVAGDAVCFYIDTNNGLVDDSGTANECKAANGVAGGQEVDISGDTTQADVAATLHTAINSVVAELTATSVDNDNEAFATATMTLDAKDQLANSQSFILTDNAAAGDAVCFYIDTDNTVANDGATSAECKAANGFADGVEVDVSGATTAAEVAALFDIAIDGVVGELLVTSTDNTDGTLTLTYDETGTVGNIGLDANYLAEAAGGTCALTALANGVDPTLTLTQDKSGVAWNIGTNAGYLAVAAGGTSALTAFTGGDNTAADTEADTDFAFESASTADQYELNEDLVLDADLSGYYGGDKLTSIKVNNTGDADASDLTKISVWQDDAVAGWGGGVSETLLVSATSAFWNTTLTASNNAVYTDGSAAQRIFVTVNISPTATDNRRIGASIPKDGVVLLSNNDGPTDVAVTNLSKQRIIASVLSDTTPPAAPSNVEVSNPGTGSALALSWTKPSDNDFSYVNIYRSTISNSLGSRIHAQVTGVSKTDTGLTDDTTYYYTLRSVDLNGNESANVIQYSGVPSIIEEIEDEEDEEEEEADEEEEEADEGEEEEEDDGAATPVSGMTQAELRTKIIEILAQIEQLQAILTEMRGVSGRVHGCVISTFNRTLKAGMSGDDIKCLQIILNSSPDTQIADSGPGSPGNETNFFGKLTKAAAVKFQEKHTKDVLKPYGLNKGTGFVGKTTRAKLNSLLK